mmetsp:Transcript_21207/g.52670  ORF Transcript_21207/g.52670 Transcript_21207/m.52670 type:complete len:208 (-) Transcript_21207:901-1524(-)
MKVGPSVSAVRASLSTLMSFCSMVTNRCSSSTCSRSSSVMASSSCVRSWLSLTSSCAPSATVSVRSSPPPDSRASSIRFSKRDHWNLPCLNNTCSRRSRRLASRSVKSRLATYGYATSRKRKSGCSVMQMPSCVRRLRMTRLKRSGMRMGYWYTSLLKSPVTVRKLKVLRLAVRASCQMLSSAGTMGRTSVPGLRNPRRMKSPAMAS